MSYEEYADGHRGGTFPREWGPPVGRPFSEERANWIRKMVHVHAPLTRYRQLAAHQVRLLAILRAAEIARREPPT